MKIVKEVPFDEIVYFWLKAEWDKQGFNKSIPKLKKSLIDVPDLHDKVQNQKRLELLKSCRPNMINPLPNDTKWNLCNFDMHDLGRLYIVPSNDWLPISKNTYTMSETLKNFETDAAHSPSILSIYGILPSSKIDTKIILVASDINSPITIIEGNHRGVALVKYVQDNPDMSHILNQVYLGISPNMKNYIWHIESRRQSNPVIFEDVANLLY